MVHDPPILPEALCAPPTAAWPQGHGHAKHPGRPEGAPAVLFAAGRCRDAAPPPRGNSGREVRGEVGEGTASSARITSRYRRGRMEGTLDPRSRGSAAPVGPGPLAVVLRHPPARATLRATVTVAEDGRRRAVVVLTARGRGWARIPAAVAAVVGVLPLRFAYRSAIEGLAGQWNTAVPEAAGLTADQIGAEFLAGLTAP